MIPEGLMKALEKMPPFPASVSHIMQMTSDMNTQAKEIVNLIKHDPVLTVRILSLVNSAYFSIPKRITSVNQAFVLLGLNTTKNLLLKIAIMATVPNIPSNGDFSVKEFLVHSLGVAVVSRLIAQQLSKPDAEEYFVAGLLHDFGKLVLMFDNPTLYVKTLEDTKDARGFLLEHENKHFGYHHSIVGKLLVQKWNLSEFLYTAIEYHHSADQFLNEDGSPVQPLFEAMQAAVVVQAANEICSLHGIGFSGDFNEKPMPDSLRRFCRLSEEMYPKFLDTVWGELEKAKLFIGQ